MKPKKPVVAYCRVATLGQKGRGNAIDIQIREVTRFAQREGLVVRRVYKDEGQSGVAEDRKALQRLLRDCEAGKVRSVIISSLDRLARNVGLAEQLLHRFSQAKVEVLIAEMPPSNDRSQRDIIERLRKGRPARE